ncbi:MAG: GTPase HflX [Chlamydiales bacterium]|nr:GTPase HflX [Chlamydiales bacterium]
MSDNEKLYEDERYEIEDLKTAMLVGVYINKQQEEECLEHLNELQRLTETFGLEVVHKEKCFIRKYDAGTYVTEGKLKELAEKANEIKADVIIFDDEVSPNQQRNIEKIFGRPTIDRTELIIEVFAQRAHTKEATLQIELAKIRYQMPRLKRLWTHLSRQRVSGKGHLKGEGEKQIEIDKRILKKRITRLEEEISIVRKQREEQRKARIRSRIPTLAIVGYTNVGKSTLLNALTNAGVLEEDKLFATLDTTTRKFTLPNHQTILLIDTVGFIRKLPHTLVAAFKSTLEEVCYTDILLHLVDVAHTSAEEQAKTTLEVLKELGAANKPIITVLNKIDLLENKGQINRFRILYPHVVAISAHTKEGFDEFLEKITQLLASLRKVVKLRIPQSHYAFVSRLQRDAKIIEMDYEGNDIVLTAEIPQIMEHEVIPFAEKS